MSQGNRNYASLVPRRGYADDLVTQEAELASDAMLERFRESRSRLSADRYRPAYHFVSPESTMNDPNGLCLWQGRWHLFYQAYPPEDPRQHWGHAVSDDMVRWRDLPYAIYPNPEHSCFSGATFVEDSRVIAMYHGTEAGNMVATSSDPLLLNWEKLTGEPVIPMNDSDQYGRPYRVFDPCIWKQGSFYYSLSAGWADGRFQRDGRAVDHIFRSRDLTGWEHLGEFVESMRFPLEGDDGACPYFWPINDRHILLTFSHRRAAQYVIGTYDTERQRLVAERSGSLSTGAVGGGSIHAPSAFPLTDGSLACIYNVNSGKPTGEWDQVMSVPRRYSLTTDHELTIEPVEAVASLRRELLADTALDIPANEEVVVPEITGTAIELRATIAAGASRMIELRVLRSDEAEEYTSIRIHPRAGLVYGGWPGGRRDSVLIVDGTYSSIAADVAVRPPERAEFPLSDGESIEITIYVDRSIVEAFVNGRAALTRRVYPERPDSTGVSIRSAGNPCQVTHLQAWSMQSIYES